MNKNAKDKTNDDVASALANHNIKAGRSRKLHQLIKRTRQLDNKSSVILATQKKYKTSCSHLRHQNNKRVTRIKEVEYKIEQLHAVTIDKPLFVIPIKRTKFNIGSRAGAAALGKLNARTVTYPRCITGAFAVCTSRNFLMGRCTEISVAAC